MSVSLSGPGGTIASFDPEVAQSWVATFDSRTQDPPAASLTADYTISFTDPAMYEAFRDDRENDISTWSFIDQTLTAKLNYRRKRHAR